MKMYKIICVVGARPNFMKIAPIIREISLHEKMKALLVHTGQHYDEMMKRSFFDQLGIPEPDVDLEVGSGSHAVQTAEVMKRFEPILDKEQPDAILVVGDVNSTIACSLVAVKKNIPIVHVEAGLRSYDREMPEEINRVLTDQISSLLFTTEKSAASNLVKEGIVGEKVQFVGNVMIDTLMYQMKNASPLSDISGGERLRKKAYALLTLHRPSNVDDRATLSRILDVVRELSMRIPIVFPVHPRTQKQIDEFELRAVFDTPGIITMKPVGYHQMIGLMSNSNFVLTDSGGIQEETTALGVPCVTLRENTERPITVLEGTNTIVGSDPEKIRIAVREILEGVGKAGKIPEFWDGKASQRIVSYIYNWLEKRCHK